MVPTTFPAQNTRRLVHFHPDVQRSDFARIEDIGADAISAARTALAQLGTLPTTLFNRLAPHLVTFGEAVERRRVLNEEFRRTLADMLRTLEGADVDSEDAHPHDLVCRALRDALDLSHRVADLLAAEKDIGWHRGFRD